MNKIVVIGSINTDMVVRTDHIPAPGETILGSSFFITGGGKGANQAVAVAKLGGHSYMVGKVGSDVFGEQAILNLQYENVDTNFIYTDTQQPSGVALIAVADNGENSIIVAPGANSTLSINDIVQAEQVIAQSDYVMLQLEIPLDTVAATIDLAKKHHKKVILNPAPAALLDNKILKQADIIIPNQSETLLMTNIEVNNSEDAGKAAEWFHQKGITTVVITMAEHGCFISDTSFKGVVQGYKVDKVVDTVAAGDTFCGALAVALSEGMNLPDAAKFANIAAALSVTKEGAQASIPLRGETDNIFLH
ncbi:MAG TPA: ribokinase [Chitinophagaceae bacterium]|nr:ribokinase [Chitinophagaceae bacterium]